MEAIIEVAIVEDDTEIRQTLGLIIDGTPGYQCVRMYGNCESALKPLEKEPPDVVLMDIELPGISGVKGVEILKAKLAKTDFIMLTVRADEQSVFDSICAGATGYLLKNTPPAHLLAAIKEVHAGGSPMSAAIARKVLTSFQRSTTSPLSVRETEILRLLCDGQNYKVIAESLFVSPHTVRSHIKNIYQKLHVSSRAEAVRKALKDRLI